MPLAIPVLENLNGHFGPWALPAAGRPVELDLGCGRGNFLLDMAERHPERLYLGADVMLGRLRRVLHKAEQRSLGNVYLLRVSAWPLIAQYLPEASLTRVHLLCPDPWPKARHRPHRLVTSELLGRIATRLVPGGILNLGTDNDPYFAAMVAAVKDLPCYAPAPDGLADIADLKTDFERRWESQGGRVQRLVLRRK